MSELGWVAFLGAAAVGAPARYLVEGWIRERTDHVFPWGTFVVNVSGCLLLGLLTGLGLYHGLGETPRTVLGTGGLGAYTTFSTMSVETVGLAELGALDRALWNALGNVVAGLAAASLGLAVMATL